MWRRQSITFSGMERYALANPGLTKIKLAENYARQAGMEAFFKKTFRRAGILGAAVLLLVLAALWGGGARIASQQRTNRAELAGGIQEIMEADASIQEIRMMDSTHFYVYLDSDVWERSTQQERAAYCETLSERLEAQCRVNGFLGSRETLRVYYYNGDGRLLAWPADH